MSATQEQIEKLKMDGISTIETEKKISTIKMLEAYGKESKNEVIDAITRIIDSSPSLHRQVLREKQQTNYNGYSLHL